MALAAGSAAAAAAFAVPPPRRVPVAAEPQRSRRPGEEGAGVLARLRGALSAAAGLGAFSVVGGLPGAVVGAVAAVVVWRAVGGMEPPAARRRREELQRGLPHAVDLMAAALASGASPSGALRLVAAAVDPPLREELGHVSASLEWGVPPSRVWSDVGKHPQLGPLGRALTGATESGSSVVDAMQQLSDDLRGDLQAEVESRARTVGVKATAPLGLCLLPAFVLVGVVPLVAGSVGTLLGL